MASTRRKTSTGRETSTRRRGWQGERRDAPSLSEVLYALRERRLLVAGVVLVLAGAALLLALYLGPVYAAEATVSVRPQEEVGDEEAGEEFMREVQVAVVTEDLLRRAMRRASWEAGMEKFRERLDARPFTTPDGEPGLRVRFSGDDPGRAARAANARAANAYAELFAEGVGQLDEEWLPGGTPIAGVAVESKAVPPEGGPGAKPLLYAIGAAGAGLLLGSAAATLLEGRTRGWRGVRDAELTLRAPVLGAIPDYSVLPDYSARSDYPSEARPEGEA